MLGNKYYVDKETGKPLKIIIRDFDVLSTLAYRNYYGFQYDALGRPIRMIVMKSPETPKGIRYEKKQPAKGVMKCWEWNTSNEITIYKDSLGNHYDKAWGITNPYANPTLMVHKFKIEYISKCDLYNKLFPSKKMIIGQDRNLHEKNRTFHI